MDAYKTRYRNHRPIAERLWGAAVRDGECLLWRPESPGSRYGVLLYEGKRMLAHRLAYTLENGPIPDGLYVCHRCDRMRCIEPTHLFLGTAADNARDGHAKGRYPVGERHPAKQRPETRPRGERHSQARLTQTEVDDMRRGFAAGMTGLEAARLFGISTTQASRIRRGETW